MYTASAHFKAQIFFYNPKLCLQFEKIITRAKHMIISLTNFRFEQKPANFQSKYCQTYHWMVLSWSLGQDIKIYL